jgi:succinate dehydrogenase/fumarate reductase flavoprotein subunit
VSVYKCTLFDLLTFCTDLARITPVVHYTMGGLRINSAGEVLRNKSYKSTDLALEISGTPIPGLFAAGEVTGGRSF